MKKLCLTLCLAALPTLVAAETVADILVSHSLKVPMDNDEVLLKRAQTALDKNTKVCNFKDEQQLGTVAVLAMGELRKSNVSAEAVEIIEGLNAMLAGLEEPINCADVVGGYIGMRKNGMSHSEAVAGGRVLYKMVFGIK